MKQIYLVLVMCAALPVLLLCRCSCQGVDARASNMPAELDIQKAIDNAACVPTGNYCKFQPGLLSIVNQAFTNDVFRKSLDFNTRMDAYPEILRGSIDSKRFNEIDTFKYNWKCDTIICINLWPRDVVGGVGDCKLISSMDSIFFDGEEHNIDIIRQNIYMNTEVKDIYYGIMRRWDKDGLDSICYNGRVYDGSVHGLSRWVIKDGVLLDLKYLRCEDISEHKIIIRKKGK
ncbi:MAG: hypothetical protein K2N28_10780 [Muribaculaceae bacterium]|nr:hypothetical protein [Muribaculaceae bacterium]